LYYINYLKLICTDSGECIAFGKEIQKIKTLFNNFDDFEYVSENPISIGDQSKNGFLKKIIYERNGYKVYTVLKSSIKETADNLLYEGLVGLYLNKTGVLYSCFVETYGLFNYTTDDTRDIMREFNSSDSVGPRDNVFTSLNKVAHVTRVTFKYACNNPTRMAVLTQHVNNPVSLNYYITTYAKNSKLAYTAVCSELLYILYQVYMPLAMLSKNFTHYDLHDNNVIFLEMKNKFIVYNYHEPDLTITSFKSNKLIKIIDYGRCYFRDETNHTFTGWSKTIYDEICTIRDCNPRCGSSKGFSWLTDNAERSNFICSQKHNVSHDLRLLYNIKYYMLLGSGYSVTMTNKFPELSDMLTKTVFTGPYGTAEKLTSGLPSKINNVIDARIELRRLIRDPKYRAINEQYYSAANNFTQMGTIHIYTNGRPMTYEAV